MNFLTLLFSCIFISIEVVAAFSTDPYHNAVILRAVRGEVARLPCGLGKIFLDGPGAFVIWLKNEKDFRYRFPPNEPVELRTGRRDRIFGTPCESTYCPDDTYLVIEKATDEDAGYYRCRVHYQASPSVDYLIDLKIVEPTGLPKIYSGDGDLLNKGYVGPVALKSHLSLICEVEDKDSETELYWRRNGVLVTKAFTSQLDNMLRVDIRMYNLTRGEADANFECLASNSDVSEPVVVTVVLKMYLPPINVEIRINNNTDFEAGQPRVVDCIVVGCMPTPTITWHLGNTMIRPSVHKELHDGNYTVSSLTLAPSLHDHGSDLACRVYNTYMPNEVYQDKVTIKVGYRPFCGMASEPRVGAVVGEAESAVCIVDSYPEPMTFSWTFADSRTVYTSFTKVVGFKNRYSSHLNWLSRGGDVGSLSCSATNKFGEMKKACFFNVSAGGPPEVPSCEVTRIYPNSLRANCKKGWDGGRSQIVHLDIVDEDGVRLKNVTDRDGVFYIQNIVDKQNVTAVLYATNTRGKSKERTIFPHFMVPISEANNYVQESWIPYLDAAGGVFALALFLAACVLGIKFLLSRYHAAEMNPDIVPRSDGIFHREPDFTREERVSGAASTCITVNTLTGCQNQYSSTPLPTCRVLLGHDAHSSRDPSSQHSYYV